MSIVAITGWVKGCNTVAAIKELREMGRMPLNEAHSLVSRVLSNETVEVSVLAVSDARRLADSLTSIGLLAAIVDESKLVTNRQTPSK